MWERNNDEEWENRHIKYKIHRDNGVMLTNYTYEAQSWQTCVLKVHRRLIILKSSSSFILESDSGCLVAGVNLSLICRKLFKRRTSSTRNFH